MSMKPSRELIGLMLGLSSACHRGPPVVDVVSLVASTGALAVDWRQTRMAAEDSWSRNRVEEGFPSTMMIGSRPSPRSVDAYFAATALLNAAVWVILPRHWRSAVPGALVGAEIVAVIGSWSVTPLWGRP